MSSPIPVDIGERTTPELFGMFFNYGLMGALIVQVSQYYCMFPKDANSTQAVVYTLCLLELAETGMMSYYAYEIYGAGYGDIAVLDNPSLPWVPAAILPSLTVAIVQVFYAHRIHSFSRSKLTAIIVTLLALLHCGAGVAQGILLKLQGDGKDLGWKPPSTIVWLTSAALSDLFIAVSMTIYLRRETSGPKTWASVAVLYVIETGALITLFDICQIFIQFAFPTQDYFETGVWTLGKLHSNALLALLNGRGITVGGRDQQPSARSQTVAEINFPNDSWLARAREARHCSSHVQTQGTGSEGVNDKQPDGGDLPVENPQLDLAV